MLPRPAPHGARGVRALVAGLVTVVVLFALMVATARERPASTAAENMLATLLYPVQSVAGWTSARVRGTAQVIQEILRLREENARLRAELARLRQLQALYADLENENRALRAELGLKARSDYSLLPAQVIVRSPSAWFSSVVIDRGSRDGVRVNMAVVNSEGLVGKVERVTPFTSTVKLLIDPDFQASVLDAVTGEDGRVQGRGSEGAVAEFPFNRDARVEPGHALVTSGLGAVLPRGLLVGTVETVGMRENNLVKFATVRPAVNFTRLDFVQVVLTAPDEGTGVNNP